MNKTALLRGNNARAYLKYLKAIGIPFEMVASNYTIQYKADGLDRKFVHSMQTNRAFACFAKLKKDLKDKPTPYIDMDRLSYFVHDFKHDTYVGDVINIDLKSAYATILYMDGYITRDTFKYLCNGNKQERLVSIGMLASKKQHFSFRMGEIVSHDEVVSPFSNFFFYAVRRTSEIMGELSSICGNNYLFTWVDGLYCRPDKYMVMECDAYLRSLGFKSSIDSLRNFNVRVTKKKVTVDFEKYDKARKEWERKPFNLPLVNSEFKRLVIDAILSNKSKIKSK